MCVSNSSRNLGNFRSNAGVKSACEDSRTKHVVQSVLLISATACISFWVFSYDGDERDVFRVAVETVHGSDGVEQYVLRENSGPCTPFGMSSFHRKKLAVPVSANASFWIKNFICRPLPAHLPLKHSYALASERDLQSVYTSANPDAKTALLQAKNCRKLWRCCPFSRGLRFHSYPRCYIRRAALLRPLWRWPVLLSCERKRGVARDRRCRDLDFLVRYGLNTEEVNL